MKTYKFFPKERTQFLQNLGVRFTQRSELNDRSELLPEIIAQCDVSSYIQELKSREWFPERGPIHEGAFIEFLNDNPEIQREVVLQAYIDGAEVVGLLSLSKSYKSPVMWAHYCGEYTGYVVEFDASHSFFQTDTGAPPLLSKLTDVRYSRKRQQVDLQNDELDPDVWITKDPAWKYEREQRMFRLRSDCDGSLDEGRISIWFVPPDAVTSIILGDRASESLRALVIAFVKRYPHVRTFVTDTSKLGRVSRTPIKIRPMK